jgi:acyl carrier protein
MAHEDLRETLRSVVAEVTELDEIPDSTPFKELGIDSMMAIEIIAELERRYKLKVAEPEIEKVNNLDSLVALFSSKLTQ